MSGHVDIIVKCAKPGACKNQLRTEQMISPEQERGPVTLRLALLAYRASEKQNRLVERSCSIQCRTPLAARAVRQQISQLMKKLDGARVVEEPPASANSMPGEKL